MANEGGYSAGSIFLQVVPSFKGFEAEARKVAKAMEPVIADGIDEGTKQGTDRAKEHIKDALAGPETKKNAKAGGKQAGEEFSGAFEEMFKRRVGNAIKAIGKDAGEQGRIIRSELEKIKDVKIGVDVDAQTALNRLGEIELRAKILGSVSPTIDVEVNAKKAAAELGAIRKEIAAIDGKKAEVKVDVDTAKASAKLSAFNRLIGRTGSQAEDTANSFRAFNGVLLTAATLGPALIPILVALAGGMAALGPAAVAATAGIGGLAIGFSGLGDAIKALGDVQKNAAKDLQANTKKMRNAAEGVADAERSLARARRDAAQSAEDSARRVVDAQEGAARRVKSALESQERAEKELADAQKDATKAQQDLRQARLDAQADLDDIAARQKRNRLDERQAVIDLFNATVDYNAVQADAGSTNLEREQSSINLEEARMRLADIRKEEAELAKERTKGVKDSEKVKSAEENVAEALERQAEAQKAVKDAAADVREAQIEGARDVADALEAQKRAAVDSAESIADAQRGLTRATEDYRDAVVETGELGSASMQKLNDAMSKLGPAGQAFARFIFGLKDEFYAIRNAVQAGLFPGLTAGIKTLVDTYLPDFTSFMGEIGKAFGDIARVSAQTLTNDTWKQFFGTFRQVSPELIKNYAQVFLNLATVVAQLATITAPFAVQFSKALVNLTQKLVDFGNSSEGQKLWLDFLDAAKRLGPPVLKFIEALVPAFVSLVEALVPIGSLVLTALTGVLEWIAAMDPKVLQGIVTAILTLVVAFQLASAAAIVLQAATAAFASPIGAIIGIVVALAGVLIYLYQTNETARKVMDAAWKFLKEAFVWYIQHVTIPILKLLWAEIKIVAAVLKWAWENILAPTFSFLAKTVRDLWNNVLHPVFSALAPLVKNVFGDIAWLWNNVLWPIFKVIGKIVWELWQLGFKITFEAIKGGWKLLTDSIGFVWRKLLYPIIAGVASALGIDLNGKSLRKGLVSAFQSAMTLIGKAWDKLTEFAKKPVKFVIETVFNNGLIKGFNVLADKLGMDHIDPIPVPKFANGGVYGVRPGYTPGRDTHLIAVGGGEAILRPELTRALGREWVYGANAAAKSGGTTGARRFLGGFKDGGIVWPVSGYPAGTPFGKRGPMWSSGYHTGQDFPAPVGTPIHAVMGGRVSSTAWSSWGGMLTRVITKGLGEWFYAHQSRQNVSVGDNVTAGQILGLVGATGNVTGPHLHLELRVGGRAVDPMRTIQGGLTGIGEKEAPQEKSRLEKILGGLGAAAGWVKDAVMNPLNWLKSKVEGPINSMKDQFGDNWLTKGLAKLPERFFDKMIDRIKGIVGGGSDEDLGKWAGSTSDLQRMVQSMAASKYGWSGGQWAALNWLVSHESSWNPNAQNPTSSAYGLFQFLNGTWSGYGPKTSDPRLQAEYGLKYIKDRYGSPAAAKDFWEGHHWYADGGVVDGGPSLPDNGTMMYDNGGYLPPGLTTVVNLTGKPEPVFTAEQFERMRGGGGGGFTYAPTFNASDLTADDVMDDFRFEMRRLGRGS